MDVRPAIKGSHKQISTVICKDDGTLQITYFQDKAAVIDAVLRHLASAGLNDSFVKVDFIEVPRFEVAP